MANSKLYRRNDETFEEGRFAWFVSLKPAFAAPLRHVVIHNTNPKRLDLVIDTNGQGLTPRMMYRPNFMPLGGIDGNLHEVIERSAVTNEILSFRLCVYDGPAALETWRQLEFQAVYGPVHFKRPIDLPEEISKHVEKDRSLAESASFTLTVSGSVEKTGDWSRVDEPGIRLELEVTAFRAKRLQEIAEHDKAERQAQSIKNAVDAGKGFATGLFELIGNIHREAKNSADKKKALEARQGSFHTQKDLMQIFGDVYQILQKPLGAFRFSVKAESRNLHHHCGLPLA
ncbi:MAG TPA: hypothetical protein V6C89_21875 [Drouetiella sp.]